MTTATQYAVLACLLALITATPSFAQTRPGTAVDSGYPPYHCIPLKVDSVEANAAIEAEQESRNRAPPVHWYSDPAALSSGTDSGPEPWGVVPLPRRPASPRR
jgi:hypothetical protein